MELMKTNPVSPESDVAARWRLMMSDLHDSEPPLASICTPDIDAASTATRLSSGGLWRRTGGLERSPCQETDTILVRPPAAELARKRWELSAREVINQRRAGGGTT